MQMWVLLFVCLCKVVTKLHRRGNSGYDKQSLYYLTCLLMKVCVFMCVCACVSMCVCLCVFMSLVCVGYLPDLVHAPRRLTMLRWGPR